MQSATVAKMDHGWVQKPADSPPAATIIYFNDFGKSCTVTLRHKKIVDRNPYQSPFVFKEQVSELFRLLTCPHFNPGLTKALPDHGPGFAAVT